MAVLQPLLDLVELCARHGLRHAVISPGSRSAALTLAFARHPEIQTYVIPDERAAAYIGLGLAQGLGQPVALLCTSGTAALNFAPAVAEAFFAEVPLLVLTADRPHDWVHQQDGQTIYQSGIYGKHARLSFDLPADYTHPDARWAINRIANEALLALTTTPTGPVHLNVPIREPFYPQPGEAYAFGPVRVVQRSPVQRTLAPEVWAGLLDELEAADRVLIAAGQGRADAEVSQVLRVLSTEFHLPVLGDVISNLNTEQEFFIDGHDVFLQNAAGEALENLRPDLLITFGNSFISKSLKTFLRKHPPARHWHLRLGDELIDTFQTLTRVLPVEPSYFFSQLVEDLDHRQFQSGDDDERDSSYLQAWQAANRQARKHVETFLPDQTRFNEFSAVFFCLRNLPDGCQLHLANSMAVRYANYVGLPAGRRVEVFANRGTSGIDGCLSTAVGAALSTNQLVFLLIGDLAFFYDRNALWHPHVPANLRVILLNNHGGGIFRLIDGPGGLPEQQEFFETPQPLNAARTAQDAGLDYALCQTTAGLQTAWEFFVLPGERSKILEIETDGEVNAAVFAAFKAR